MTGVTLPTTADPASLVRCRLALVASRGAPPGRPGPRRMGRHRSFGGVGRQGARRRPTGATASPGRRAPTNRGTAAAPSACPSTTASTRRRLHRPGRDREAGDGSAGRPTGVLLFNPGGPGESGVQILPVLAALVPPAVSQPGSTSSASTSGAPAPATDWPAARRRRRRRASCRCRRRPAARCRPPPSTAPGHRLPDAGTRHCSRTSTPPPRPATWTGSARRWASADQLLGPLLRHRPRARCTPDLFPDRVRAMILDGAVDGTPPLATQAVAGGTGHRGLPEPFLRHLRAEPTCPLGPDPARLLRPAGDPARRTRCRHRATATTSR